MNTLEIVQDENKQLRIQLEDVQKKLDEYNEVFRQVIDFSSMLGVPDDLKEVYRSGLHLFKDLLELDVANLFLVVDEFEGAILSDTIGLPESMIGKLTACRGMDLPGCVLVSGQLEIVDDFRLEKRFPIPDVISKNKIISAIGVPMIHNENVFGVIVGNCYEKILFSDEQKALAQVFANQLAVVIKNAIHIQSLSVSERQLQRRTDEINTIFTNSMTGVMLLRGGRVLARCNQRLADLMGYDSPDEMVGMGMREIHLSEERFLDFGERYYKSLVSGEQIQVEYQLRRRNGQSFWCMLSGKAIDPHSPPDLDKGVVWIIDDISERKNMEEQLLKSQKLESIAVLSAGLAHDFNNIITSILGNISLSMATIDSDVPGYSFLAPAKSASLRAKDLTQKLLTFSKGGAPVRTLASLPEIIEDSADFALSGSSVKVNYTFDDVLWDASINATQISQVLQNLIMNSQQAMPGGGNIDICCVNFSQQGEITGLAIGKYLKITITDNGHGIAPAILDKIFDPYFTTKDFDSVKGSGLGLALVHSIVRHHDGMIFVDSVVGKGSKFTLYLPAVAVDDFEDEVITESLVTDGKGRVLVMDDDKTVRDVLNQMLVMRGYDIEESADGEECIVKYLSNMKAGTPFDLVIMDLTIPGGMGGKEAAQEVLKIDNNAKIVVSSGYSDDPVMVNCKEYGFVASVNKPFEFGELGNVINSVMTA